MPARLPATGILRSQAQPEDVGIQPREIEADYRLFLGNEALPDKGFGEVRCEPSASCEQGLQTKRGLHIPPQTLPQYLDQLGEARQVYMSVYKRQLAKCERTVSS